MSILYVNAPAFAVAIERLQDPSLRRYPVVVAAQEAPRAPILSVSSEAYALGVRKGVKLAQVRQWDRRIRIISANPRLYEKAQKKLGQVVEHFTPFYQAERLGTFSLNMKGTTLLFGKTLDAAEKIQKEVTRVLGLRSTIGAAENRLVSRIAAKVIRPKGLCDIFPGNEAAFLSPLELDFLPIFREIPQPELLRELAIRRIGDLVTIPTSILTEIFGKKGETLKQQAQGIDATLVKTPEEETILSKELILSPETNNDFHLLSQLWKAIEKRTRQLREHHKMAREVRLQALYVDQQSISGCWPVCPPSNLDFTLFALLKSHWSKFLKRRVALKSIDLTFTKLCPEFHQLGFEDEEREFKLCRVLDQLRRKYGDEAIRIGKR